MLKICTRVRGFVPLEGVLLRKVMIVWILLLGGLGIRLFAEKIEGGWKDIPTFFYVWVTKFRVRLFNQAKEAYKSAEL